MQRHIYMRNVISQIADLAQLAYQGVVRDHFPCWVWYQKVPIRTPLR